MIKYLSKYPEQFSNNPIQPVVCPLVMFKLFRYINEVDSHNKSRQSDLAFGKVLGCSVWLDTVMYKSVYGNKYYKLTETI